MPKKINLPARGALFALILTFLSFAVNAQKTVTGKIANGKDKQPLVGATVSVRGSNVATQTDVDGAFKITVPNDKSILVITAGFEAETPDKDPALI